MFRHLFLPRLIFFRPNIYTGLPTKDETLPKTITIQGLINSSALNSHLLAY